MKKRNIGIMTIVILTLVIGSTLALAAKDNPNQPWNQLLSIFITNTETDPVPVTITGPVTIETEEIPETKCVEIERVYPDFADDERITIDLAGYKDLQITWYHHLMHAYVAITWTMENGTAVYDILRLEPVSGNGNLSFKVLGNYLRIRIYYPDPHDGDHLQLIFYATK